MESEVYDYLNEKVCDSIDVNRRLFEAKGGVVQRYIEGVAVMGEMANMELRQLRVIAMTIMPSSCESLWKRGSSLAQIKYACAVTWEAGIYDELFGDFLEQIDWIWIPSYLHDALVNSDGEYSVRWPLTQIVEMTCEPMGGEVSKQSLGEAVIGGLPLGDLYIERFPELAEGIDQDMPNDRFKIVDPGVDRIEWENMFLRGLSTIGDLKREEWDDVRIVGERASRRRIRVELTDQEHAARELSRFRPLVSAGLDNERRRWSRPEELIDTPASGLNKLKFSFLFKPKPIIKGEKIMPYSIREVKRGVVDAQPLTNATLKEINVLLYMLLRRGRSDPITGTTEFLEELREDNVSILMVGAISGYTEEIMKKAFPNLHFKALGAEATGRNKVRGDVFDVLTKNLSSEVIVCDIDQVEYYKDSNSHRSLVGFCCKLGDRLATISSHFAMKINYPTSYILSRIILSVSRIKPNLGNRVLVVTGQNVMTDEVFLCFSDRFTSFKLFSTAHPIVEGYESRRPEYLTRRNPRVRVSSKVPRKHFSRLHEDFINEGGQIIACCVDEEKAVEAVIKLASVSSRVITWKPNFDCKEVCLLARPELERYGITARGADLREVRFGGLTLGSQSFGETEKEVGIRAFEVVPWYTLVTIASRRLMQIYSRRYFEDDDYKVVIIGARNLGEVYGALGKEVEIYDFYDQAYQNLNLYEIIVNPGGWNWTDPPIERRNGARTSDYKIVSFSSYLSSGPAT